MPRPESQNRPWHLRLEADHPATRPGRDWGSGPIHTRFHTLLPTLTFYHAGSRCLPTSPQTTCGSGAPSPIPPCSSHRLLQYSDDSRKLLSNRHSNQFRQAVIHSAFERQGQARACVCRYADTLGVSSMQSKYAENMQTCNNCLYVNMQKPCMQHENMQQLCRYALTRILLDMQICSICSLGSAQP